MRIRNMVKSRKAISPILATLLLIVIAVAAIVVTYAWIMTYMSSAGQQAGVIPYKLNVNFQIVSGQKRITIDIGNSGTSSGRITGIYVGPSEATMESQMSTPPLPITLGADQSASATIVYNWTAGAFYHFKVDVGGTILGPWPEQAPQ